MVKYIQANPRNVIRSLYHHGLVKILIVEELHKRGDNWDAFLLPNGFSGEAIAHEEIPREVRCEHDDKNDSEDLDL
jgi:hypothetical protein